jgi:hypothetical protein
MNTFRFNFSTRMMSQHENSAPPALGLLRNSITFGSNHFVQTEPQAGLSRGLTTYKPGNSAFYASARVYSRANYPDVSAPPNSQPAEDI